MTRLALVLLLVAVASSHASEGAVTPIIPRIALRADGTTQHAVPAGAVGPPAVPLPAEAPPAPHEAAMAPRHAVTLLAAAALAHPTLRPVGLHLLLSAHAAPR